MFFVFAPAGTTRICDCVAVLGVEAEAGSRDLAGRFHCVSRAGTCGGHHFLDGRRLPGSLRRPPDACIQLALRQALRPSARRFAAGLSDLVFLAVVVGLAERETKRWLAVPDLLERWL